MAAAAGEDAEPEAADARRRAGHGEVVLVVEDEPAVRGLVVDVLDELGYRAARGGDGPAGLQHPAIAPRDRPAGHRCRPARA